MILIIITFLSLYGSYLLLRMDKEETVVIRRTLKNMTERPLTFRGDNYTLTDTITGVEYWLASGFMFYGIRRPYEIKFSLQGKILFNKALKRLLGDKLKEK